MAKSSAEIAIELRGKFEFYLLALTFGILGLSIQTAKFDVYLSADIFELTGWLALFISGLIGILRGDWIPVAYDIQSKIRATRDRMREVANDIRRGSDARVPFTEGGKQFVLEGDEAVFKLDGIVQTLEGKHKATEEQIIRCYKWMRLAFLVGGRRLLDGVSRHSTGVLHHRADGW